MTAPVDARHMTDAEYQAARRAAILDGVAAATAHASAAEMERIAKRYLKTENKS